MIMPAVWYLIGTGLYIIFLTIHLVKKASCKTILIHTVFYFYMVAVIGVTLFPLPFEKSFREVVGLEYLQPNLIPFRSIMTIWKNDISVVLKQIGGNILLTLPLGILVPLTQKKKKFAPALLIGVLFSVGIELLQFLISAFLGFTYRITDIDDVILNTLGFIIGFGIFKLFEYFAHSLPLKKQLKKQSPKP